MNIPKKIELKMKLEDINFHFNRVSTYVRDMDLLPDTDRVVIYTKLISLEREMRSVIRDLELFNKR